MRYRYEHMTLGQIGQVFNASSHLVGKWLVEIGLRYESSIGKKPSRKAFSEGYVQNVPSSSDGYMWAWHSEKTVKALEEAGHPITIQPGHEILAPCTLNGPFRVAHNNNHGFNIVNGDESVAIVVSGEENVRFVNNVLNLAHKTGALQRILNSN